ncbi:hypothetical protein C5167_024229 [Papaver somniferum]|uniref:Uncharacterized protein n=1 Tax=Papaver somniferum TaxID=3469 RepID=A0A4Y7JPJ3_PAPSO|nr:hypothetical protein C5167_024229 [Papaver somniferum]
MNLSTRKRITAEYRGLHQMELDILSHFCTHLDGVIQMEVQERQPLLIFNSKESFVYTSVQELKMEIWIGGFIEEPVCVDFKGANSGLSTLFSYLGKDSEAS